MQLAHLRSAHDEHMPALSHWFFGTVPLLCMVALVLYIVQLG
jgi:hypothetical protein